MQAGLGLELCLLMDTTLDHILPPSLPPSSYQFAIVIERDRQITTVVTYFGFNLSSSTTLFVNKTVKFVQLKASMYISRPGL